MAKISTEFEQFVEIKGTIFQEGQCENNEGMSVRDNGAERKHSSGIVFYERFLVYDVVSGNTACPMPLSIFERDSDNLYHTCQVSRSMDVPEDPCNVDS